MKRTALKFKNTNDTGFGTQASSQGERLVNKDGSYNVKRVGLPFWNRINHFHDLITMKWWKFFLFVILFYTTINLLFAGLYLTVGMEEIEGDRGLTEWEHFWDAFFFSSQTMTTVGYGRTSPIGFLANLVAAAECLVGLMSFAILTGVLYGRFSRPQAKIIYSKNALIAPFKDGTAVMFRIANGRPNQLIECEAQLMMSYVDIETNIRRFIQLPLEIQKVSALALSWTIVHPIDENSPMNGVSPNELAGMDCEFVCLIKAFDETYAQTVHSRHSYPSEDVVWGAKFEMMYHRDNNGKATVLDLEKVGRFYESPLPKRIEA
ncbi:MAG: ion channel [Bacteroidota bacterium]